MNKELYKSFLINSEYDYNKNNLKKKLKFNSKKHILHKNNIPKDITHLCFDPTDNYDINLNENSIPNNIIYLNLGHKFNKPLKKGDIPNSIKYLIIGDDFNQELNNDSIPNSVIHLEFGFSFNKPIKKGDLPNSIKYIVFGERFNQELNKDNLPSNIKHLEFKNSERNNEQKLLLNKINYLEFSNGSIDIKSIMINKLVLTYVKQSLNYIPNKLLELSIYFEKDLLLNPHILPNSIRKLTIQCRDINNLTNIIPNSVKELKICCYGLTYIYKQNDIPFGVEILVLSMIDQSLKNIIPNSVKKFRITTGFNNNIEENELPNSITHLDLGYHFNKSFKNIPNSITHLSICRKFNKNIIEIPNNVKYIKIDKFNINIINKLCLFDQLIEIIIIYDYDMRYNDDDNIDKIEEINNPNNIIIKIQYSGFSNNTNSFYKFNNYKLNYDNNNIKKIKKIINREKLIGKIILKELVEKVFHPDRLIKISQQYNIELFDLVDLY